SLRTRTDTTQPRSVVTLSADAASSVSSRRVGIGRPRSPATARRNGVSIASSRACEPRTNPQQAYANTRAMKVVRGYLRYQATPAAKTRTGSGHRTGRHETWRRIEPL